MMMPDDISIHPGKFTTPTVNKPLDNLDGFLRWVDGAIESAGLRAKEAFTCEGIQVGVLLTLLLFSRPHLRRTEARVSFYES